MDRRAFLAGALGLSAATALSSLFGAGRAEAMPNAKGILDELDSSEPLIEEEDLTPQAEPVHNPRRNRRRRRRRRREWRRECRRERWNGVWRRRCRRRRVWVWYWI